MKKNPSTLNEEQVQFFHENGYLVLKDFVDSSLCKQLREKANGMVGGFDPKGVVSIFSTTKQEQNTTDYFMDSGDKIRFFFEEEAFTSEGNLKQEKEKSINKIGHALHDLDPLFQQFSYNSSFGGILRDLGQQESLLAQSMYIFKQPKIGGEVVCHQDSTFLYTEPMSVIGLWFALEDATLENGCLWALPGGHKEGVKSRLMRTEKGKGIGVTTKVYDKEPWTNEGLVPLEVTEGSLIVLHGSLPHMSRENRSEKSRHAYAIHAIDGVCDYPAENWLQRSDDMPFQKV